MSAYPQPRLTPEQYLEIERAAEFRSEYYNGRMFAMSGGSGPHAFITANCVGELGNRLKDRPYRVAGIDLRVRASASGLHTYPDISVLCVEPQFADRHTDTLVNPALIVEVFSPSTEAYDRGFKFAQYRTLESLQEYVLVSETEPRVEVFRRQPNGDWLLAEYVGLNATCRLESAACAIPLAEIYDKVTFPAEEEPSDHPSPGA